MAIVALGCAGDDASLRVDLRTDFVPGVELREVRTIVDDDLSRTLTVTRGDELFEAGRVADFDAIARGEHRIEVTLLGPEGELARRSVRVRVEGDFGVTVLMTRDCRGVACPGAGDDISALSCLGGTCVSDDCVDGTSPDCPEPECRTTGDCDVAAACTDAECVEGVCVYRRDDSQCAADEYCDPDDGCVSIPDTDAGTDAGPDAGSPDVGFDAGTDATADDWLDPMATRRALLTIGTSSVPLSNVPVVVVLDPSRFDYAAAAPDGSDVRFYAEDGTLLPHEIERFGMGGSWIWVGLPSVGIAPQSFSMYWGGASVPARMPEDVWSPAFVAVHHMAFDRDSTRNANHAGWVGVAPGDGSLGPTATFLAADLSHMRIEPSPTLAALDRVTISAMVRHAINQIDWRAVMARQLDATTENDLWMGFFSNRYRGSVATIDTLPDGVDLTGPVRPLGSSTHIAVTYDGSTARLYADGVMVDMLPATGSLYSSPNPIWIGADSNGEPSAPDIDFIEGEIDELRIEATARSEAWIEFQHRVARDTVLGYGAIDVR